MQPSSTVLYYTVKYTVSENYEISEDFLCYEKVILFFQQLAAVHLVDSHHCSDPTKFISVLLTSLSTMIHVELPHVNVLSKIDLVEQYGKLGM